MASRRIPGANNPVDILNRGVPLLIKQGIHIDRAEVFVRTLHPNISGRSFLWEVDKHLRVIENSFAYLQSDEFVKTPVGKVIKTGETIHCKLNEPQNLIEFTSVSKFIEDGYTELLVCPLIFVDGQTHAITYATKYSEGFSFDEVAALKKILKPLSRITEIIALKRTAVNLLNTYVGHGAGERILSCKIRLGDSDIIRAVIWFSDLRDFTSISIEGEPGQIIKVLNDLFECQVPIIEKRGGEVLKFIGDGLFAVFPLPEEMENLGPLCDKVLAGAHESFSHLELVNQRRISRGEFEIQFGLALHVGEIAFGNIGGASRLDFTCIGTAVNHAARLEGLTGKFNRQILISEEFAKITSFPVKNLGRHELKGFSEYKTIYGVED